MTQHIDPTSAVSFALVAFLTDTQRKGDGAVEFADIAFPAGSGAGIGSQAGRELWDGVSGLQLAEALVAHPTIAWWAKGPPSSDFVELRRAVATFVAGWVESGQTPGDYVEAHLPGLMDWFADPNPVTHGFLVVQGVSVESRIQTLEGIELIPANAAALSNLTDFLPISRKDIFRLPDRATLFALATLRSNRGDWGAFANVMALGWCRVRLRGLQEILWLTTGAVPALCDEFYWERSSFARFAVDHFPAPPESRYRKGDQPTVVKEDYLLGVHARLRQFFGEEEHKIEDSTWLSLWMARSYLHAILTQADPLFSVLLGYAALDGLYRDREEKDGVLGPRVAEVIGSTDLERRRIRSLLARLRDVRGVAAHGRRPLLVDVAHCYGRTITQADFEANPMGLRDEIYKELETQFLAVLRRSILAYLWMAIAEVDWSDKAEAPSVVVGVARAEMLSLVDRARTNDSDARDQLGRMMPDIARHRGPTLTLT